MKLEANIFPVFEAGDESVSDLDAYLAAIPKIEKSLLETPLHQNPIMVLAKAEFDDGPEFPTGVVDDYEFIITRRFKLYGEWHVGGANGEILNVYAFLSSFKAFWESQADRSK